MYVRECLPRRVWVRAAEKSLFEWVLDLADKGRLSPCPAEFYLGGFYCFRERAISCAFGGGAIFHPGGGDGARKVYY